MKLDAFNIDCYDRDFEKALEAIRILSIEHEDSLMSGEEGLLKAVQFLKDVMIHKPRGTMWWD